MDFQTQCQCKESERPFLSHHGPVQATLRVASGASHRLIISLTLSDFLHHIQDAFHPSHHYDHRHPGEDWKTAALRGPALPALGNAVAGAAGSAISNVVVYPLNVLVVRLQAQKQKQTDAKESEDDAEYTDLLDAARKIYSQRGIAGFYPGITQDTYKTVADSFLFFLAYTTVRQRRIAARFGAARVGKSKHVMLPVMDELSIGILAGAFAKLFTTPLANIVTRKQTATSRKDTPKEVPTSEIAARIRSEKGLLGFWSGYSASLILTLNPSITFFLNEVLKYTLLPREKSHRPSPAVTFFLAAISKAAASSITYPFSLAKTRAQALSHTQSGEDKPSHPEMDPDSLLSALTPQILSTVLTIAGTEGIASLYTGLEGEVLKGFFSHGFTMLAKDAVYASIVKLYYILLIILRRFPSPEELLDRAREAADEYSEVAREGARDMAERTRVSAEGALGTHSGAASVDMTSTSAMEVNETAELVGDYVEDEAAEWRSFYHWFWEKEPRK